MNLEKLVSIRNKKIAERQQAGINGVNEIHVCSGQGCISSGSQNLKTLFEDELKKQKLNIKVVPVGCFGICAKGPIVRLMPKQTLYCKVKSEDVSNIVQSIKANTICENLLYEDNNRKKYETIEQIPFFKHQKFVIQKNLNTINANNIEDYIEFDGYFALNKVITKESPTEVIDEIKKSGLRGRGGAGFPTGKKWEFAQKEKSEIKYIICNADEGDPGAFMNRSVLEGNPHAIIEGMAIAGYGIGAKNGVIYVRAEYKLAAERLKFAIEQARAYGFLGKNIYGTNFIFDISLSLGAGAFVCGEETALIKSVEGKRGEPNPRPPYPAVSGIFGKPTVINNVETLANIPIIIRNGASWFSKIGTPTSTGTKVFAVSGKINNSGLVELPLGTPIKTIINDICGGAPNGKQVKAVQIGGPSGGCVPTSLFNLPVDYDSLTNAGLMMGSGGLIVIDSDTCVVDFAKFFLQFICDESCGKCTPCRIGNKRVLEMLQRISDGKGTMQDLSDLEELCLHIKSTSLCGLGQSAPNPVLTTLKYFKPEYIEHIKNKHCPAFSCKNLIKYKITDKCVGCGICKKSCPVQCISGALKTKHEIDFNKCIKCGLCFSKCPVKAIIKEDRF